MSTRFVLGQRWVVDSEPDLGLGIIVGESTRTVDLFFEQGDCERRYAKEEAPLTRIVFEVGDTVDLAGGEQKMVKEVFEQDGLVLYLCAEEPEDQFIPETKLSGAIQLNQPFMRLMTGQIDKPAWFAFRRQLDSAVGRTWRSRLNGLLGTRASLIPHQLYIAWTACSYDQVRVLLADEVGLGKTIEAGMILTRMIKSERIARALIAVPDALQVQWLVELIRKFDLTPDLYAGEEHDFQSGQIHIVPHSTLKNDSQRLLESEFDLVLIDEAHHILQDTEEFTCLDQLSQLVEHLILLTATPEQLGLESHFARLHLLDKNKFANLEDFKKQEANYAELNQKLRALPEGLNQLITDYKLDTKEDDSIEHIQGQLLDRHGVGRSMFRNVRKAIEGFPSRIVDPVLLDNEEWETKFEWLATFSKNIENKEKLLVICHDMDHVFQCQQYLWSKHGIDTSVFHEEQSLMERDKAAAYFAEDEFGCQILICSEIGSEGRNFQFSHHLICLDLPEHPDLLEQRIGRLDRIGQEQDVNIHILFAENSTDQIQFFWFNDILECIAQQNPAAGTVHDTYWADYSAAHENSKQKEKAALEETAKKEQKTLRASIESGRDALLEMNSCRQPQANTLAEKIALFEQETPKELIETASDLFNFHFEESHGDAYSLIPSDKMVIPSLPGVPSEGCEVTFSRATANARDELKFVSWDSPFIQGLWELLNTSELGSASVAMFVTKQLPAGHCLLETCFDISIQSPVAAEARPFLSQTSVRSLVLDVSDKDLSNALSEDALQKNISSVNKKLARQIIRARKENIPQWFKKNDSFSEQQKTKIIDQASQDASSHYDEEIDRLEELSKVAEDIDHEHIEQLKVKKSKVLDALLKACILRLSAIRLIVISDK